MNYESFFTRHLSKTYLSKTYLSKNVHSFIEFGGTIYLWEIHYGGVVCFLTSLASDHIKHFIDITLLQFRILLVDCDVEKG